MLYVYVIISYPRHYLDLHKNLVPYVIVLMFQMINVCLSKLKCTSVGKTENYLLVCGILGIRMRHCKNIINDNLFMLYILNSCTYYLWLFVRCWYLNNFIDCWSSKCMQVYFCLDKTKISDHSADCWLPNFNFITDWAILIY